MDIASKKLIDWHLNILPLETKKAFDFLSKQAWLEASKWYLAGGTALALRAGNRKSFDLDFFTRERNFDNKELLNKFSGNKNWKVTINQKNTVYGELFDSKISFIAYPFFIPKQEPSRYGKIKILAPIDIAVMKIIAISQRGRKRDFFDLYWCANNLESLEKTIGRLKIQYPSVAHDFHHILKSLVYFKDAENDPELEIYFKASWITVKKYFTKEVRALAGKLFI